MEGNMSLSGFMRVWTLTRKVMYALRKRKTISGSEKVNQSSEASGFGINNEVLSDFLEEKCE